MCREKDFMAGCLSTKKPSSGFSSLVSKASSLLSCSAPGPKNGRRGAQTEPLNDIHPMLGSDAYSLPRATPIRIGETVVGSSSICWMTGPAYVESFSQMYAAASLISEMGAKFIRSRAYWPKAKADDFQRHLASGLEVLKKAAQRYGLYVVSEMVSHRDLDLMVSYCDVIEIHPRLLSNIRLLKDLGRAGKTVILTRHPMMTVSHFLSLIRHLEEEGCLSIILAESGARDFDPFAECLFDLSAIITLRRKTDYPILVDCSRLAHDAAYIEGMSVAAIAAGADGVLAEMEQPERTGNKNSTSLMPRQLQTVMQRTNALKSTLNAMAHLKYVER
jgi:3-deoxy-7-phosphoheptulonate synthase